MDSHISRIHMHTCNFPNILNGLLIIYYPPYQLTVFHSPKLTISQLQNNHNLKLNSFSHIIYEIDIFSLLFWLKGNWV